MLKYEVTRDDSWLEYTRHGECHREDGFALLTQPLSDGTIYRLKSKYGIDIEERTITPTEEHTECLNIVQY